MNNLLNAVCGLLLSCSICPQTLHGQYLHLANEIVAAPSLESVTKDGWRFSRLPAGASQSVAFDDIVRWGAWPGIRKQQAVWLSDGSWLVGELQFHDGKEISVASDWLDVPPIELNSVRGLVVSPPSSQEKWSELQQAMKATQGAQDVVWLLSGQQISGILRWASTQNNNGLILESRMQEIEILLDEVKAIVFSPALTGGLPERETQVLGLRDGSLLRLAAIQASSQRVACQLQSGLQLQSYDAPAAFASGICYLSNHPGGVSFLSDLEPASYRNLSDNALQWELGKDQDVYGKPLRPKTGFVDKGLALHSSSQVAYRWSGAAAQLLAEVVLAPSSAQADNYLGSVNCQVLLARAGALEKVYETTLKRATKDAEQPVFELVDIDITGAQLIVLVVEKSDFGQYADHVFWLDARISENVDVR